jgi:hypothetical protein
LIRLYIFCLDYWTYNFFLSPLQAGGSAMTDHSDRWPVRFGAAADLLLDDYLQALGHAARKLPLWQRDLFLDQVAGQIDAELGPRGEVDVTMMRDVLNRLGSPQELVRSGAGVPDWPAGQELAAVIVLLVGGIVLPVVGWLVGVVLLWASPRWQFADKLVATLIWPGGLAGLAGVLFVGIAAPAGGGGLAAVAILAVVAGVPPVLVAVRMLHTARRPRPVTAALPWRASADLADAGQD